MQTGSGTVKCCLDTNVLDWIVDNVHGNELLDLIDRGIVSAIVAADNGYEVHRIPDGKREQRERLQALLKTKFLPMAPTHVPIAGIARAGLARIATPYVMSLRELLHSAGIVGLDSNHLINASRESREIFVTLDKRILRKGAEVRRVLGVECLEPGELLERSFRLRE